MAGASAAAAGPWAPVDQRSFDRRWKVLAVLCTSLVVVASKSLGAALKSAGMLSETDPGAASQLVDGAKQGYVAGMHLALLVAAVVAIVAAGLVLRYLPGKGEVGAPAMAGSPERRPTSLEPEAA